MRTRIESVSLVVGLLLLGVVHGAAAQGDKEGAIASLAELSSFSVDATVEGPEHLAASEILQGDVLIGGARNRLLDAGIPASAPPDSAPNLHIHLNMMQMENGLIAFSVELDLFQDVILAGSRQQLRAVTWNESAVGLVSHDMTSIIAESVHGLVDQFARDFRSVN